MLAFRLPAWIAFGSGRGIGIPVLQTYLVPSFVVVAYEKSGHIVEVAAVTGVAVLVVWSALLLVVVGSSAGASRSRLVQYGILGETGLGDSQPRSRPMFAAWTGFSALAVTGAMLSAVIERAKRSGRFSSACRG